MKILFLLQDIPFPPATGINSKAFNLIKRLSVAGWQCDLLCFATGDCAARKAGLETALPRVKVLAVHAPQSGVGLTIKKALNLFKGLPPSLAEYFSPEFLSSFRAAAVDGYDVVHYDVINMAQYLDIGLVTPSILSSNDAISLAYERMIGQNRSPLRKLYLAAAAVLIRNYERKIYPRFSVVHVVSEDDAAHLRDISPDIRLAIIPLAVDRTFLDYRPVRPPAGGVPRVAFVGNLSVPGIANGLFGFLEGAYPGLSDSATFDFRVLGPNPSVRDTERMRTYPGLKYFSWVDDYKAFLSEADIVLVLDKSGTGIKTRVLEAMALGKPVVGTSIAFGGISVENGKHCYICDTPEETATYLKRLITDRALCESMGGNARELILAKYSMSVVGPKWEALYSELAAEPRGNARG